MQLHAMSLSIALISKMLWLQADLAACGLQSLGLGIPGGPGGTKVVTLRGSAAAKQGFTGCTATFVPDRLQHHISAQLSAAGVLGTLGTSRASCEVGHL